MTVTPMGFALGGLAHAIKALYGVVDEFDAFIERHIEEMKVSANSTIARTGRVIEGAKFGFGIGYMVPIAIIAVGQLLLGNPLSAASAVANTVTFTNPVAMTCAAVGAIYYGWEALSELERSEILEKISHGLTVGIELIRSIIAFVITKTKDLLTSENVLELKRFIAEVAEVFGRTLADVTGSIADKVKGAFDVVVKTSSNAVDKTKDMASDAYLAATDSAGKALHVVKGKLNKPDRK